MPAGAGEATKVIMAPSQTKAPRVFFQLRGLAHLWQSMAAVYGGLWSVVNKALLL